jgi:hypothetical protein
VTTCCFIAFSLDTVNDIGDEGAIKLSEALKENSSLTSLGLYSNRLFFFISISLNTGNDIGVEGVIKLSEALKSNTSVVSLDLSGSILSASFDSHSIQVIILVLKELSNYLMHSK